jgi:purine-binding chemotaxis protein CheW
VAVVDKAVEPNAEEALVSSFYVGDALFGFDTTRVQEVVRVGTVTPVHDAPEFVRGVMNLRGRIVTVVDLAAKLALGATDLTDESRIYIVEWKQEHLGLVVDRTADVLPLDRSSLKPPPENVRGVSARMIEGLSEVGHRLVAVLGLDAILEDGEPGRVAMPAAARHGE